MTFVSVSGKCPHCQRDDQLLAPSAADLRRLEVAQRMHELLAAVLKHRGQCYIPNVAEGLFAWDERAAAALAEWEKQ